MRGKRCSPPPQFLQALRDSPEPSPGSPLERRILKAEKRLRLPIARDATILSRRGRKPKALLVGGNGAEGFSFLSLFGRVSYVPPY